MAGSEDEAGSDPQAGGPEGDASLVARVLGGDAEAFEALMDRYLGTVTVLAWQRCRDRAESEDIAQEAFVRAYKSLNQLKDPKKFAPWLYNIAFRLSIDHIRRRSSRRMAVSFDELAEKGLEPFEPDPAAAARAESERNKTLWRAVEGLPDRYRLVVTLRYMKKMSYKEIAEHLDEPEGTVANRLHRATRMLRERLERGAVLP